MAVYELLGGAEWRVVKFLRALNQTESRPKFPVKRFGIISFYLEAAAFVRALWAEGADDDVTTRSHCRSNATNVRSPILWLRQEVKNGAIVPDIEAVHGKTHLRSVRPQPSDPSTSRAQAGTCHLQRGFRNVEHCDGAVSTCEQVVHQRGRSAADINDRRRGITLSDTLDERNGSLEMGTKPTHLIRRLRTVNLLPMVLHVFNITRSGGGTYRHREREVAQPRQTGAPHAVISNRFTCHFTASPYLN